MSEHSASAVPEPQAPSSVVDLAELRVQARADKDYARSDALRDEIAGLGWIVKDVPGGYELVEKPPYRVYEPAEPWPTIHITGTCAVGIIVDGWAQDLQACVESLVRNTEVPVLLLDNAGEAGSTVHQLATDYPSRVTEIHVSRALGWAAATTALMAAHDARVHLTMDMSSILDGDAITPLVSAIDGDVVGAGWQGADVDLEDQWRSVVAAGPGEVDVLLGYLMAVDRSAGLATPPNPKANFYRNADLEWSLMLRAAGGRLVVPRADLPVHQERHHGYHDTDPALRDKASKKTYDRILAQFRGRTEILRPRG